MRHATWDRFRARARCFTGVVWTQDSIFRIAHARVDEFSLRAAQACELVSTMVLRPADTETSCARARSRQAFLHRGRRHARTRGDFVFALLRGWRENCPAVCNWVGAAPALLRESPRASLYIRLTRSTARAMGSISRTCCDSSAWKLAPAGSAKTCACVAPPPEHAEYYAIARETP